MVHVNRIAWGLEIEEMMPMSRYRLVTGKRKGYVLRNTSAFKPKEHVSRNTSSVNRESAVFREP